MRTHKQPSRVVPRTMPPGTVPDPTAADRDPTDPVQQLDEAQDFHVEPLDVNVYPEAERQDEVDAALELSESDEDEDERDEVDLDDMTADERTAELGDVGELYGVHLPPAQDPQRGTGPDLGQYAESELGETWLETLETDTAEGGRCPSATSIRTTTATSSAATTRPRAAIARSPTRAPAGPPASEPRASDRVRA
jgi:hypothetical protein